MTLEIFLKSCRINKTSWQEKGKYVNIRPQDGEIIQFFLIDTENNQNCKIRQLLNHNGEICDLIVSYQKNNSRNKIVCLVELKGTRVDKAANQILSIYKILKECLNRNRIENCSQILWRAYILRAGSSPIKHTEAQRLLLTEFDSNEFKISRKNNCDDLGKFIRDHFP